MKKQTQVDEQLDTADVETPVQKPIPNAFLIEAPDGSHVEASADEPINPEAQTLFVQMNGVRFEHCATTADGRWVYRKS